MNKDELYKSLIELASWAADDSIESIACVVTFNNHKDIYFLDGKTKEAHCYELIGALDALKMELVAKYHESEYFGNER